MHCLICSSETVLWAWQPLGPDMTANLLVRPRYHYRGFPALPLCEDCAQVVRDREKLLFVYRGQRCLYRFAVCIPLPEDVIDEDAYFEAWMVRGGSE